MSRLTPLLVVLTGMFGCVFDRSGLDPRKIDHGGSRPDVTYGVDLPEVGVDAADAGDMNPVSDTSPDIPSWDAASDTPVDTTSPDAGTWYHPNWQHRKKITIDSTKVSGSTNLVSFPVLISRIDAQWADTGHGGAVGQADGGDILFTDSDGIAKLDHEIERYDNTTGEIVAWVEVPTVSCNTDTEIFIYYGNTTVADQWNISGTWDGAGTNSFRGVWHLEEDPGPGGAGEIKDSTSHANHGTADSSFGSADLLGAQIGQGIRGTDEECIIAGSAASLDVTGDLTISHWARFSSAINWANPLERHSGSIRTYLCWFSGNKTWSFSTTYNGDSSYTDVGYLPVNYDDGVWHHWTVVRDFAAGGGGTIYFYKDGSEIGTVSIPASKTSAQSTPSSDTTLGDLEGVLDEVRISNTVRSAGWIGTEYHNQSSPGTFYSVGLQETP